MLSVADVVVTFERRRILDRVSLDAADGEVVALLGPSGSGKSTLLRVIAGLITPEAGTVSIDGRDVTRVPTHQRGVGMVFQDEQLFPHRDVAANVGFGLRMQGVARAEREARVTELLAMVGLAGFERRRVTDLSGGEAKRVALARSLAPRPGVLLLDEPLTGLDRQLHDRLADDLARILRTAGTTVVLVTHDRDEADRVADRVVRLGRPVCELRAAETHDLRRRVLRDGTPSSEVRLAHDDEPDTFHLGVRVGERVVVTSSWSPVPWPGDPERRAVQLRMMATDPSVRGTGLGRVVLDAGVERAARAGAELVWANARDSALGFYQRAGFEVIGAGFVTSETGLPHHVVVRRVSPQDQLRARNRPARSASWGGSSSQTARRNV